MRELQLAWNAFLYQVDFFFLNFKNVLLNFYEILQDGWFALVTCMKEGMYLLVCNFQNNFFC